jgi:hypothetical protein
MLTFIVLYPCSSVSPQIFDYAGTKIPALGKGMSGTAEKCSKAIAFKAARSDQDDPSHF